MNWYSASLKDSDTSKMKKNVHEIVKLPSGGKFYGYLHNSDLEYIVNV